MLLSLVMIYIGLDTKLDTIGSKRNIHASYGLLKANLQKILFIQSWSNPHTPANLQT